MRWETVHSGCRQGQPTGCCSPSRATLRSITAPHLHDISGSTPSRRKTCLRHPASITRQTAPVPDCAACGHGTATSGHGHRQLGDEHARGDEEVTDQLAPRSCFHRGAVLRPTSATRLIFVHCGSRFAVARSTLRSSRRPGQPARGMLIVRGRTAPRARRRSRERHSAIGADQPVLVAGPRDGRGRHVPPGARHGLKKKFSVAACV